MTSRADRIRVLNDNLRRHFAGGTIVVTRGVRDLSDDVIRRIGDAVSEFDGFNTDNDPYGEHDFGSVIVDGKTVFFKIDAYDITMGGHSPDPADPEVTRRVLTIMLADEN